MPAMSAPIRDAVISRDGQYRYCLSRQWNDGPELVFVMLNPSTADAMRDDPTIRKCIGFADRLGYGAIRVVNLFAMRATDPDEIRRCGAAGFNVVGPENDRHIAVACLNRAVVLAWGAHGRKYTSRTFEVAAIVRLHAVKVGALDWLADRVPAHPLMLPYTCVNGSKLHSSLLRSCRGN